MNQVRVGIIGLGSWGQCHLEAYSALPQVEVVAICDSRQERLDLFAGQSHMTAHSNIDELLDREDIDLVSIVTFEQDHLQPTLQALRKGKHVIVEKPVSTKLSEAEEMWKVAQENKRQLFPGHLLRFDPRYADIQQALHTDRVGKPISMYLKRARPQSLFQTYQRIHTVYELMIHDLDLAIWYAASRVKSVRAYEKSVTGATVPDILWSNLEFENGVLAVLQSNWMVPDQARIDIADSIEVIGSKGMAHFESSNTGLQIWNQAGRNTPDFAIHHLLNGNAQGALKEQLSYVCDSILGKADAAYTSFPDAIHGVEVAEAIIRSSREGREIQLSEGVLQNTRRIRVDEKCI